MKVLRNIQSVKVKATHPMILAQKVHSTPGLTMEKIKWLIKDQCVVQGAKLNPDLPPRPERIELKLEEVLNELKWRITQKFSSVSHQRFC
jgi:hypothetical protein